MSDYSDLMREFPPGGERQVVLDNMQDAPYNRWAFAQMRRLLPSANIWRGEGPVMELSYSPVDLGEIEFETHDWKTARFADLFGEDYTDAIVVLKDGVIVYEHYREGVQAHEPHLLMSVSKSFAGSLTGVLVEQGKLSVDDKITDILPEVTGSAYDDALVRHVLDMTVGLEFNEDYDDPDSDIMRLDMAAGWRTPGDGDCDNLREYFPTIRKAANHGQTFHYASVNTDLLGWVLERCSGKDLATLYSELFWQPMGAEHDAYILLDRLGAPQADGGLCTTTRDMARFGQLHLQQGGIGDRQIIPQPWIEDTRNNGDTEAWDRGSFVKTMPGHSYRNKWYINCADPHRAYLGVGIHGQYLFVDPKSRVVIAHFASHPQAEDWNYDIDVRSAFAAVGRALV